MSVSCNTDDLIQASACFRCIPPGLIPDVNTFLLCQIANIPGGGGSVNACLVAQSGGPVAPCAYTFGIGYDNDAASPTAGSWWFWDATGAAWVQFITGP